MKCWPQLWPLVEMRCNPTKRTPTHRATASNRQSLYENICRRFHKLCISGLIPYRLLEDTALGRVSSPLPYGLSVVRVDIFIFVIFFFSTLYNSEAVNTCFVCSVVSKITFKKKMTFLGFRFGHVTCRVFLFISFTV